MMATDLHWGPDNPYSLRAGRAAFLGILLVSGEHWGKCPNLLVLSCGDLRLLRMCVSAWQVRGPLLVIWGDAHTCL